MISRDRQIVDDKKEIKIRGEDYAFFYTFFCNKRTCDKCRIKFQCWTGREAIMINCDKLFNRLDKIRSKYQRKEREKEMCKAVQNYIKGKWKCSP